MTKTILVAALLAAMPFAADNAAAQSITTAPADAVRASFDIVETTIVTKGDNAVFTTRVRGETVEVSIPLSLIGGIAAASFDGVTAGLKVNANLHAPLLCVDNVFKVASGDLSLPGKVAPAD